MADYNDLIFCMVMGHLVGDFLLQTNQMALKKKESTKWCALHCFVYTGSVLTLTALPFSRLCTDKLQWPIFATLIFVSHFALDRTHLVDRWLELIGSRSYASTDRVCKPIVQNFDMFKSYMVAYTALVQTVADNTLHVMILYFGLKLLLMN